MDTTTVDYAIAKLNEAFAAIQPTAVELGQQYIDFIVMKTIMDGAIWITVTLSICIVALWLACKHWDENEALAMPCAVIGGFAGVFAVIAIPVSVYNIALVLYDPLMFIIDKLAK